MILYYQFSDMGAIWMDLCSCGIPFPNKYCKRNCVYLLKFFFHSMTSIEFVRIFLKFFNIRLIKLPFEDNKASFVGNMLLK